MKQVLSFLFILLESVCAHYYDPSVKENIGVYGDVPKSGYLELSKERKLTIREALERANFDTSKLQISEKPYPFRIEYIYSADRVPNVVLDLENDLQGSLETSVNLGATIGVYDYHEIDRRTQKLEQEMNKQWTSQPALAFQHLQRVVGLKHQLHLWRNPALGTSFNQLRDKFIQSLSDKAKIALNRELLRQVSEHYFSFSKTEKTDERNLFNERYIKSSNSRVAQKLEWLASE